MNPDQALREQLVNLLSQRQAHMILRTPSPIFR